MIMYNMVQWAKARKELHLIPVHAVVESEMIADGCKRQQLQHTMK